MPALLALLLLPMLVPTAHAQMIYRCTMIDGSALYADRPCHVMNAVPMQRPGDSIDPSSLPARLGGDRAGIPSAANGCPAVDPPALQLAMHNALSSRDLNALAGLYAWDGAGRAHADHVLESLQALITARPSRLRLLEADGWTWTSSSPPGAGLPRLHFYRDAAGKQSYSSFQLVSEAGCVWLGGLAGRPER